MTDSKYMNIGLNGKKMEGMRKREGTDVVVENESCVKKPSIFIFCGWKPFDTIGDHSFFVFIYNKKELWNDGPTNSDLPKSLK